MKTLTLALSATLVLGLSAPQADADDASTNTNDVSPFEMSLEELMDVHVVIGSVTGTSLSKVPASVTTITRTMIEVSTARNVADLMEIYVPGALWLNHLAPRIGIRGIIIDRNYKILLLVNGRNINQKGSQGATLELQNWDLNDIERIEIVRGPGSVTYGPGAIAGVINIITRTGSSATGSAAGVNYTSDYDSMGAYGSYGYMKGPWDVFAYASVRETGGADADFFRINSTTGEGRYYTKADNSFGYEEDNMGEEQVKAHIDMKYKDWRVWARYTRSGWPCDGLEYTPGLVDAAGESVPFRFTSQEGYILSMERHCAFSDAFSMDAIVSYDSEHYTDHLIDDSSKHYDQDPFKGNPPGNVVYDFIESEVLMGLTGQLRVNDHYRFALGYNFSYDMYDKGDGDQLYMNFKTFETDDGRSIQDLLGNGFEKSTHSVFAEANLECHPLASVMVSGRMDKHDDSDYLYSPRVAWVAELTRRNIVKLLWQRSVRMSTAEEMAKESLNGRKGDSEELTGYELLYATVPTRNTTLNLAVFYNELEAIGWIGNESGPIGTLEEAGAELEGCYRTRTLTIGASHAYTKQLNWDSAPDITTQGISASDYDVNGLTSEGNDLSNWPRHMTKLFVTARLPGRLTAHADSQIFWKWEGNQDYVDMYNRLYGDTDATWNNLEALLDDEDYADGDVRLNASVAWQPTRDPETKITLFALNLLGARRYGYSSGVSQDYPRKINWVEEPTVYGVKFDCRF